MHARTQCAHARAFHPFPPPPLSLSHTFQRPAGAADFDGMDEAAVADEEDEDDMDEEDDMDDGSAVLFSGLDSLTNRKLMQV